VQVPAALVLAAVIVIVTVAVVSGSGHPPSATGAGRNGTAMTESAAPPTSAVALADTAVADRINLTGADLPPGWARSPNRDGSGATDQDAQVAACAGAPDPRVSVEKDVASDDYSLEGMDVSSDVTIVKSVQSARQDLAAMQGARALACFRWFFPSFAASSAPAGTAIHVVSVNSMAVSTYGEGSFGFRVVMNVTSPGVSAFATVDEVGFLTGRLEVSGVFTGAPTPFPAKMENELMAALARRAAAVPAM
jgi:hypothetical protein